MFRQIGPLEIFLIIFVVVLLFGAKKLPELARGSGRALRIFKAETKGLLDDDDEASATALFEAAMAQGGDDNISLILLRLREAT